MARLYKRGDVFWCWFYDPQKRRRCVSTRCTDRRAAELAAHRLEREAADPSHAAAHATTLRAALERLVVDRGERGRAAGTVAMYRSKSGHFRRLLGDDFRLAELTARVVDDYIAKRLGEEASRSTVGKELTTLRAALRLAKRRGELAVDIAAIMPIGWSIEYRPRTSVLRRARDLQALVDELIDDRGAHACFIVATGARWGESLRATRADVDLARGVVRLRGTKTAIAAAPSSTVPVVGWMRPLLEHVLRVCGNKPGRLFRPWTSVRGDLAAACRRAGIEKVTPNDLRRTTATWLRAAGVEPSILAAMLRHADTRMVERVYGRLAADALGDLLRERLGEPRRRRGRCSAGVAEDRGPAGRGGNGGGTQPSGIAQLPVPRDGIEPPTRGFSIRPGLRGYRGARGGFDRRCSVGVAGSSGRDIA